MAALSVILIILGLVVVPNSLRKVGIDNSKIYELFAEVNIDNQKMINYPVSVSSLKYTDEQLKSILGNMKETYPSIEIIYILIKKGVEIKFYTYNKNGFGEITESQEQIVLSNVDISDTQYNFPFERNNFYYLIIKEKNGQQYVIKG